ncbi:unnamed protein product [Zymoseptoria tritici ST99CH_3D7]|uniref:F-box domain-containing protein n=1 Tax=Zymoseptoria tritici (strain ST99CH_3D7) TaxID=1276538 RepID=A0A1X7S2C2_ZYMT9|nr:unnamed protein product [Zymoseptoria tritici ST99CH_3D7]
MDSHKRKHDDSGDDRPQKRPLLTRPGTARPKRPCKTEPPKTDLSTRPPSPPPKAFALLRLPQNVQNIIYEMVLRDVTFTYPPSSHLLPKEPPLVMTCRHIYNESLEIFYANASFVFGHCRRLAQWKAPHHLRIMVQHKVIYDLVDWNKPGALASDNYESVPWRCGLGPLNERTTTLKWKYGPGRYQIRVLKRYEIGKLKRCECKRRSW